MRVLNIPLLNSTLLKSYVKHKLNTNQVYHSCHILRIAIKKIKKKRKEKKGKKMVESKQHGGNNMPEI